MKKIKLISVIATVMLTGCIETEYESSDLLKERAVVIALIHSPSEHHTDITPTMMNTGGNLVGMDYDGNSGIKINEHFQITSTTIPEKFGVAFQCEHGTFTIEGSESKHKVLYDKLISQLNDSVTILYKEQYVISYEEKDGKRRFISRVLNKLDFIDAQK